MTTTEFYNHINTLRKANKDKWYWFKGTIDGHHVELKAYNTWLQIYRIDGRNHSGLMDISVTAFKETLAKAFNQ